MDDKLSQFVVKNRDAFNDMDPDPIILTRIKSELINSSAKRQGIVLKILRWSAAAVIVLLAGFGANQLFYQNSIPTQINQIQEKIEKTAKNNFSSNEDSMNYPSKNNGNPRDNETILISNKKYMKRRDFFSKLSNQASASERFGAALSVVVISKIDHDIIGALVKTMNEDPNTNVRLAALESLAKFSKEPLVKKQLIKALSIQKDPVVQIALIELLTTVRENKIIDELRKLTNDETTTQPVKDEAYKSLNNLHS